MTKGTALLAPSNGQGGGTHGEATGDERKEFITIRSTEDT